MNRQLWDSFIQQIDAQVEADFSGLANEFEAVTGQPFKVDNHPQVLFSMLDQVMMTENTQLLRSAVKLIAQLPLHLQEEYRVFSQHRKMPSGHHPERRVAGRDPGKYKNMSRRVADFLHVGRSA